MIPAYIPSPPADWASFSIGPLTIHAYALFILAGIFFALWLTGRRWVERGGRLEVVSEIGFWAIPFGIVGGRIYHVLSSPAAYFGEDGNPLDALKIWNGGLGIWGAVALGAVGAWIGARRHQVSFATFMDAAAPAVLIAQAIGRVGNYFNQELFGGPTTLPWGLEIDPAFRPDGYEQFATFHPTFLYELLWNLAGAAFLIWADKRWDLRGGRVFWLYVAVYTSGRLCIETVRIDDAVHVFGVMRINTLVAAVVLALSLVMFFWLGARQRRLETHVPRERLAAIDSADTAASEDLPSDADGDPVAETTDGGDPSAPDETPASGAPTR